MKARYEGGGVKVGVFWKGRDAPRHPPSEHNEEIQMNS